MTFPPDPILEPRAVYYSFLSAWAVFRVCEVYCEDFGACVKKLLRRTERTIGEHFSPCLVSFGFVLSGRLE